MSELKSLKKLKSVDIEEFNGVKSKIASVELSDVEEKDFGEGKQLVRQIKVTTENLSEDKDKPITATEYISLKNEDGEWGYSESPKSKAMKFLTFFKVNSFDELVGKDCVAIIKMKENGKQFLGISHG